jgi:hypothetical protein
MEKLNITIISARKYDYIQEKTGENISGTKVYFAVDDENAMQDTIGKPIKVQDFRDNFSIYDELKAKGLDAKKPLQAKAIYGLDLLTEQLQFMKFEF